MQVDKYTYRVTWSEEDQEHVGLCVEFSGLSYLAETPEAALKGIRKIVVDAVKLLKKEGAPVPEPLAQKEYSGKLLLRIPSEIHRKLEIEARETGISLNRYINAKIA